MKTFVVERVKGFNDQQIGAMGRFWVSFVAEVSGTTVPAFQVFVARSVEAGVPFRTLVWPAVLEPGEPLALLVDQCVGALLNDDAFSSLALKGENEVILLEPLSEAEGGKLRPAASETGNPLLSSTRMSNVGFFRLDYPAQDGVVGFSCLALSPDGKYELAVMLEQSLSFSGKILNWALERHQIKQLRNPKYVDATVLSRFLNQV